MSSSHLSQMDQHSAMDHGSDADGDDAAVVVLDPTEPPCAPLDLSQKRESSHDQEDDAAPGDEAKENWSEDFELDEDWDEEIRVEEAAAAAAAEANKKQLSMEPFKRPGSAAGLVGLATTGGSMALPPLSSATLMGDMRADDTGSSGSSGNSTMNPHTTIEANLSSSSYNPAQLENWLKTMIVKHGPIWRMKSMQLNSNVGEDLSIVSTMEPLPNLLASALFRMNHLYRQAVIGEQFKRAKSHHNIATSSSITPSSPSSPSTQAWSLLIHLFSQLDPASPSANSSLSEYLNDSSCYRMIYTLLYLGSKLWHGSGAQIFGEWIKIAQKLFPDYQGMFQLLELETLAHHDPSKANRLMRIFVSLYKRYSGLMNIAATKHAEAVAAAAANDTPIPSPPPTLLILAEVCAQSLVSLHLYLGNFSPLTTAPLSESTGWDGRDTLEGAGAFDWLDHAWLGEKPPRHQSLSQQAYELEELTWELCGPPDMRISILRELYRKLTQFSFVKARVAYTIGHYTCTVGSASQGSSTNSSAGNTGNNTLEKTGSGPASSSNPSAMLAASAVGGPSASASASLEHPTRLAEKWLMECLYILDHITPYPTVPWNVNQFAPPGPIMSMAEGSASPNSPNRLLMSKKSFGGSTSNLFTHQGTMTRLHAGSFSGPAPGIPTSAPLLQPVNNGVVGSGPPTCSGLPVIALLSELGCNALILYGDILLSLDKYKNAILAFESALYNYQYRFSVEFHTLNRRLIDITAKEKDYERNIFYHIKILEKAKEDGNLNMFVYIVQQLSKLEVLNGSFRRAEEHLKDALEFLKPFAAPSQGSLRQQHQHERHHHGGGHGTPGGSGSVAMQQPLSTSMDMSYHSAILAHHARSASSSLPANLVPPIQASPTPGLANWDLSTEIHLKFSAHPSSEFRSAILNILLQLARLYLDGERIDSAINVLQLIMNSGKEGIPASGLVGNSAVHEKNGSLSPPSSTNNQLLPPSSTSSSSDGLTRSKLNQVYLLLATGYMKKKKYHWADRLLRTMEEINGVSSYGSPSSAHSPSMDLSNNQPHHRLLPLRTHRIKQSISQLPGQYLPQQSQSPPLPVHPVRGLSSGSFGVLSSSPPGRIHSPSASFGGSAQPPSASPPIATAHNFPLLVGSSSGSFGGNYSPLSPHPLSTLLDPALYMDFLILRSKIALYSCDFVASLHFVHLCFAAINPTSNLGAMARLTLRRGRIYQRIAEECIGTHSSARGQVVTARAELEKMGLVTRVTLAQDLDGSNVGGSQAAMAGLGSGSHNLAVPTPNHGHAASYSSSSPPGSGNGLNSNGFPSFINCIKYLLLDETCGSANGLILPDPSIPIQSLYDSHHYFSLIDDQAHMAISLSQIVDTYLCVIFIPISLHDLPLNSPYLFEWLHLASFDRAPKHSEPFDTFLHTLDELCGELLENSFNSLQLLPLLQAYAHTMEVKFLQGKWKESTNSFLQLKRVLVDLFVANAMAINSASIAPTPALLLNSLPLVTLRSMIPITPDHSLPPSATFKPILSQTTPTFLRGLYHILKRMTRMVTVFQLAPKPEGMTTTVAPAPDEDHLPLPQFHHERMDSLDSAYSSGTAPPSPSPTPPPLPHLLSARFYHLDPSLTMKETQAFAQQHMDLIQLFQSFISEIYGEEVKMEVEQEQPVVTMSVQLEVIDDPKQSIRNKPNKTLTTNNNTNASDAATVQKGPLSIETSPHPTTKNACCSCCTIM